jgi:hypothetical protein
METVDAGTIKEVFDLLKAGQWLKGVLRLGPTPGLEASIEDIKKHWADDFRGGALSVWGSRLTQAEKIFRLAEKKVEDNKGKKIPGHYAKTIDIVQSSGMGKSRLISEMAKEVMTISFVLRKPGQTGFPPGDMEVLDFVLQADSKSAEETHTRAMCLLGGTFDAGQYSSIPRSRCQADVTVAEWCKSNSTSGGNLLEKWNHAMSPLGERLMPNKNDRRPESRVNVYDSIIKNAEEYRRKLVNREIRSVVGSSGSVPGSEWNWNDKELVCLRTVKLTHFALLMLFSFRTTMTSKRSQRSSKILCLSC